MEITDEAVLRELLGEPSVRALTKERDRLTEIDRAWLAATPFCVLATADADGRCDVSPKGDPAGQLVHALDDRTIVLAERPGNRRADGYRNVLQNPFVGLDFLIPGRGDTLRINGRARLVTEGEFFEDLAVQGKRPVLAMVVEIETIFFHCAKALLRSQLWQPETWGEHAVPPRAEIAATLEPITGQTPEEIERYYHPDNYGKNLY